MNEPTWFTYILECCDGSFYVGSTADLSARLDIHQAGNGPSFTAERLPVRLAYAEEHGSLEAALRRERQIKRWTHAKKLALIAGDLQQLKGRSISRQSPRWRLPPDS